MTSQPILAILQHALGTDRFGRGEMYRDHFVAGPGHEDWVTCLEATQQGLMEHRECSWVCDGNIFTVTEVGKLYVRRHSPKVDAKQRRKDKYLRWLSISDCRPDLTFGDFLRREKEFSR